MRTELLEQIEVKLGELMKTFDQLYSLDARLEEYQGAISLEQKESDAAMTETAGAFTKLVDALDPNDATSLMSKAMRAVAAAKK